MRKGAYALPGKDGAEADLAISAFPGAVGGELANVNRWRSQLGLGPIEATALERESLHLRSDFGQPLLFVDLRAEGEQAQAILAAMTPVGDAMWFFKLTGPASLLEANKTAFLDFLKTVRAAEPAAPAP